MIKQIKILEVLKKYRIIIFVVLLLTLIQFAFYYEFAKYPIPKLFSITTRFDVQPKDWLAFWGAFLSFLGTMFLGGVTIYQNISLSKMNERILIGESGHLDIHDYPTYKDNKIIIHFVNRKNIIILNVEDFTIMINGIINLDTIINYTPYLGTNNGVFVECIVPNRIDFEINTPYQFDISFVIESENSIKTLIHMNYGTTYNNGQFEINSRRYTKEICR